MRRLVLAAFVAITSLALTGAGQAPPRRTNSFSDEQRTDLDRISAYLNGIKTMKGTFTQLSGNGGLARGTFMLQKPGKMRFEYLPPAQLTVVADGYSISVQNKKLNTTNRYPLINSPLEFVLSNTLDLRHNPLIVDIQHQNGAVIVSARSSRNRMTGNITMSFAETSLELRQWTIIDAQGKQTTVSIGDVETNVPVPGSAFVLNDDSKFTKNRQN